MAQTRYINIISNSPSDTILQAKRIGRAFKGGEIIQLIGDIGSGKTTFVRGIVAGCGSGDSVNSPSFTLVNQYKSQDITIYHFDFYRLNDPGIMGLELAEILLDERAVIIIEWADIIEGVLPTDTVKITFQTKNNRNYRGLTIEYSQRFSYLINGIREKTC